jgi:hypothetical protein
MLKNIFTLLAALAFLCSCSQTDSNNISINVEIATELIDVVSIESVEGEKPGKKNKAEAAVTVKNISDSNQKILANGEWSDSRGNRYGGNSSPLTLAPGQSETAQTGTQSGKVTAYKLSLVPDNRTEINFITDAVSSTTQEIAEGYGMTYSRTAADEVIPALPIGGFANDEAFQGKTVVFAQGQQSKWRLEISDHLFDVLKGPGFARYEQKGLQTINIDLAQEPTVGGRLLREMSYGGGYFQIKPSPTANSTTSWNTSIAYAIEITDWNKGASIEGPCGKSQVGTASGKLYISFKGSEFGLANSWVSGAFNDAPILYCGVE